MITIFDSINNCYSISLTDVNLGGILYCLNEVCQFGAPKVLISDRGAQFTSQMNKEICKLLGTRKYETTAYHPASNGQIERFHRTLLSMLSLHVEREQENWDVSLRYCLFAYNTSIHASTNNTPFFLTHGWDPRLPTDASFSDPEQIPVSDYAILIAKQLSAAWADAHASIIKAQNNQTIQYNKNSTDPSYTIHDLVYVFIPRVKFNEIRKLAKLWFGPYRILDLKPPTAKVRLASDPMGKISTVHFNAIKPCFGPNVVPLDNYDPLTEFEPGDMNLEAEAE